MEKSKKKTDVHHRSLNGEGNFNYRLKFPFEYMPQERCLIKHKKAHGFKKGETLEKMPCIFSLQIWDQDLFSANDYIGNMDLDLNSLQLWKRSKFMKLKTKDKGPKPINLFKAKSAKGWIPIFKGADRDGAKIEGKIEIEIELLTKEEAALKKNGEGFSEPNMFPTLEKPDRPVTSFRWWTSPFKSFRWIIWHNYKWRIIIGLILSSLLAFLVLLLYSMPGGFSDGLWKKIIGN